MMWSAIRKGFAKTVFAAASLIGMAGVAAAQCNDATDGYLLDWNNVTYTAGSLSQTVTVTRDGVNPKSPNADPITATIVVKGNTNRFLSNTPAVSTSVPAGRANGTATFLTFLDFATADEAVTIDIVFSRPVENLSFEIDDIDYVAPTNGTGGYRDDLGITGSTQATGEVDILPNLRTPYFAPPAQTGAPSTVYLGAPLESNHAAGIGSSGNNENLGTVLVSFPQPVRRIFITYANSFITTSNPSQQLTGLYDLDFCVQRGSTLVPTKAVEVVSENLNGTFNCATGTPVAAARAFIPGSCIEYTITVNNPGSTTASDILLSDQLDTSLTFVSATVTGFTNPFLTLPAANTKCTGSNCLVQMSGATLPAGATGTLKIRSRLQ